MRLMKTSAQDNPVFEMIHLCNGEGSVFSGLDVKDLPVSGNDYFGKVFDGYGLR